MADTGILEAVRERLLLYDGGMGTMLFAAGLLDGDSPEPWNWEKPDIVEGIYRAYYEAGSDVVQTNTFGGTPIKLAERDLADRTYDANCIAARALRAICPAGHWVAGDVGPIGKFLKPMGEFTLEEFDAAFEAQIQGLKDGGVDLISIETMYSLQEALSAVRSARKITSLPVSVCMTFNENPRGFFTLMGETVPQCLKALEDAGADIIGSNCTHGTPGFITLARLIRDHTERPVIVQPNRGRPVLEGGQMGYKQTREEYIADIVTIASEGVNIIGGCCGTTPEFIAGMREALKDRLAPAPGGTTRR
ncbi:MAG TPA: homocysteine S-methyltransferase family protein [Candidatus Polarisedimenticolia bacterium]|nr:homocysteine S-methyltransferase family protein [Candidatus Polarisedimenticolia bacterium]